MATNITRRDQYTRLGTDPIAETAWNLSLTDGSLIELAPSSVEQYVAAGIEVYSFGYGWDQSDLEVDEFTTLSEDDLYWFDGTPGGDAVVASWAPFAVAPAQHTVRGGLDARLFGAYGTTHDNACPGCQSTPFTASPRSESYWSA